MKKSIIAIAALAAATGALAQSSVTMYGVAESVIDIGWKRTTDTRKETFNAAGVVAVGAATANVTDKAAFRVQDGNSQGTGTSRLGWRGAEDLGGGLKATFNLEMGLRLDDGDFAAGTNGGGNLNAANLGNSGGSGGSLFGRNAWVGVSGGFGEVRLGRQRLGTYDFQGDGYAQAGNGLYEAAAIVVPGIAGQRFSNSVKYLSPNFGGAIAVLTIRAPEGNSSTSTGGPINATTDTSNKVAWDLGLRYANGPVVVSTGYAKTNRTSGANNGQPGPTPANITSGTSDPTKGFFVSANYDFGVVKPFFNYTKTNTVVDSFTKTGALLASTSAETVNKAWTVGVRVPFGATTLIAGYASGRAETAGTTVTANAVSSKEARDVPQKAFAIGAQYALSKRTMLEANYGLLKRTDTKRVTAVPAGTGSIDNISFKESALSMGVKHSF
jgi:predicted porin